MNVQTNFIDTECFTPFPLKLISSFFKEIRLERIFDNGTYFVAFVMRRDTSTQNLIYENKRIVSEKSWSQKNFKTLNNIKWTKPWSSLTKRECTFQTKNRALWNLDINVQTNVIEIEGLLFLGFGPLRALHGKLVFPVFPIK